MYDQQKMHFLILLVVWAEEIAITGSSSIPPCTEKCVCTNDGTEIKCEQQNLFTTLPVFDRNIGSHAADGIQDLTITGQRGLTMLSNSSFQHLTGLIRINLANNSLRSIPNNAFANNLQLKQIDFRNNNFTTFPWKPFRNFSELNLLVYGNPLQCACENGWLRDFIDDADSVPCTGKDSPTTLEKLFTRCRNDKPNTTLIPNFIEVKDAESFAVDCVATGIPTPEVSWDTSRLVSNHTITPISGGLRLAVHNVSVEDWKNFICFARSETGRDVKSLDLSILLPARILKLEQPVKYFQFCLPFAISGNPKPTVSFYKDGDPLDTSKRYLDLHYEARNPDQPQIYNGCLSLAHAYHIDNGRYTLKVSNYLGEENRTEYVEFVRISDYDRLIPKFPDEQPSSTPKTTCMEHRDTRDPAGSVVNVKTFILQICIITCVTVSSVVTCSMVAIYLLCRRRDQSDDTKI